MKLKAIRLGVAMLLFSAFVYAPADTAQASSAHGVCSNIKIPVALAPGMPANKHIAGTLCTPNSEAINTQTIDVLVHGGTYNREYWDLQHNYPQYSYVDRALQQGRATFAYDRLGVGASSRPLSAQVTLQTDSYALHQAINWLRAEKSYQEVTLISHSLGSTTAIEESATYNDADRLVLTGLAHTSKPSAILAAGTAFYPAMLDSRFFGKILDPAYLTTLPGQRTIFYSASANPAVIAYDDSRKDIMGAAELAETLLQIDTPTPLNKTQHITLPVLLQLGQNDDLFCGGVLGIDCSSADSVHAHEAPYYTNTASLSTNVIPNTGHNLTLHPSSNESFNAINEWAETH